MAPHPHHHHSGHHHRHHAGRGHTNIIYPTVVDSETEIIAVPVEEERKQLPPAPTTAPVNGFFDNFARQVRASERRARTAQFSRPTNYFSSQFRPFGARSSVFMPRVNGFSDDIRRAVNASPATRYAAYNIARRAWRMPGVRVAPYFGVHGDFEGYVAKDAISGAEIGCCMIAGDNLEVSGFFDIITAPFTAPVKAIAKAASAVAHGVADVATSVHDRALKPLAHGIADVATSVNDRALKPVGKFVVQNAGLLGASALAVAFPPAGAVALAAVAAQLIAKGAQALGANTGILGTITDIVDTAGGVISLNPQKLTETAGKVGGMIGKVVHSQALIDAGASVEDVAAATRGDPAAIARITGVASRLAGKVTGMKELADAGAIIAEGAKAAKGDPAAIASLTGRAAGATGLKALKTVADGISLAGKVVQGGKIQPEKMATEALRLASPAAYAALQKIDPRLLTNEGIHKLAEMAKQANPAEAAKLMASVTQKYQADVSNSVNALINNAKSADPAIRAAAMKAIEATRKLAASGHQDAQRAAAMFTSVNNLQAVKKNVARSIPPVKTAPNGGTAIFIAKNGTTSRGRFIRDPRGQQGVLVDKGQKYAGTWKAV